VPKTEPDLVRPKMTCDDRRYRVRHVGDRDCRERLASLPIGEPKACLPGLSTIQILRHHHHIAAIFGLAEDCGAPAGDGARRRADARRMPHCRQAAARGVLVDRPQDRGGAR
jgi:hypothetical protein